MSLLKINSIVDVNGGSNASINGYTPTVSNMAGRNRIINGNFDIWQRGTSFTTSGYSADRWYTTADTNSGWTVSQQEFTYGQTDVPNEPTYFLRYAISSGSLTGPAIQQRIEGVRTFAGKTVTVTFYARVSSGSTFTPSYIRMNQSFGSGGSSGVFAVPNEELTAFTSSWTKYTYTFNIPSIAGKTIGASNYVNFMIRIPDSTTTTLDIAQVQLEEGSVATPFEHRQYGQELALCQRYYGTGIFTATNAYISAAGVGVFGFLSYKVTMRAAPTVSATVCQSQASGGAVTNRTFALSSNDATGFAAILATTDPVCYITWQSTAEL